MKRLSIEYEMTTIVSIHQPNNDLIEMFDQIYILAKGGVCVFAGPPGSLKRHLIDSDIECNENQFPIEVILKISEQRTHKSFEYLIEKSKINLDFNNEDRNLRKITEENSRSKRISGIDFYYLLMRTIRFKYQRQWKEVLLQILIFILMGLSIKFVASPNIVIPSGCFEIDFSVGCNQTLEDLQNEFLIKQNLRYHFYLSAGVTVLVLVINSIAFCSDFKNLQIQNHNGKFIPNEN